jgi:hypothetical protein
MQILFRKQMIIIRLAEETREGGTGVTISKIIIRSSPKGNNLKGQCRSKDLSMKGRLLNNSRKGHVLKDKPPSNSSRLHKWNKEERNEGLNLATETREVLITDDVEVDLEEGMVKS